MAAIESLVPDIERLLKTKVPVTPLSLDRQARVASDLLKAITPRPPTPGFVREARVLWPREVGENCLRKVWYGLQSTPSPTSAADELKFSYGHLLEATLLTYAEMAGHEVKDQQLKLTESLRDSEGDRWLIRGKIDAVIDGVVVDVKSCSKTVYNDLSTYYSQVDWYAKVGGYERAGILAVEKSSGRIRYEEVPPTWVRGVQTVRDETLSELGAPAAPPRRYLPSKVDKIGVQLPDECLFCPFKFDCWSGLKAYRYAYGTAFYTSVGTPPRVPEMTREEVESAPIRG